MKRTPIIPIRLVNDVQNVNMIEKPSKTMQRKLKNVPLYVTNKPIRKRRGMYEIPKAYQIQTLDAKKYAPEAQKQMYAIIKKNPNIIKDIEKKQYKHKAIIYTSSVPYSIPGDDSEFVRFAIDYN